MKKLNKSKIKEMGKSFARGFEAAATDKTCIVLSAINGALSSEGKLTTGIYEGAKILVQASVINGMSHVAIDQLFSVEDEIIED